MSSRDATIGGSSQQAHDAALDTSNTAASAATKKDAEAELHGVDKAAALRRKMAALRSRSRGSSSCSPSAGTGSGEAPRRHAPRVNRQQVRFAEDVELN